MDIDDIKNAVNEAETSTSATREEAGRMLVFGRVNQWDDEFYDNTSLKFRGQFDLIKPKRNKILSELWANPVSITYKPQDGAEEDAADVLNSAFRKCMQDGEEAFETATMDQVDCGFGAFRFCTKYAARDDDLDNRQKVSVEPINEANNRVYWDANSRRKDRSDANWCMIINTFTKSGWERYCNENGIDYSENEMPSSVKVRTNSGAFHWYGKNNEIKIGEFYKKSIQRRRLVIFEDPLGNRKTMFQSELKQNLDQLIDEGYIKVGEKLKDITKVVKYIVSGEKVIKKHNIAGEYIPVVSFYGDWSYVEGREIWRGIYHDAQDPQRLHNTLLSYMTDIVMQGPRQKPIFHPGQIEGFEYMYQDAGADNNWPYLLQNEISKVTKQPYPVGPVGYLEPPQLPNAQMALMQQTRQAVDDVTGSMMNADQMLNSQVTEGQIAAVQRSTNMETFLYQNSQAIGMKYAAKVFASMAREIFDVQQDMVVTDESGKDYEVTVMETSYDYEAGEEVVKNNISKGRFEVYAATGPSYSTQRDQAKAEMAELYKVAAGTTEGQIALWTYLSLQEGPGYADMRKYANNQLILQGIKEPDTDEEKEMVAQAQQGQQQPDANMILAMAEQAKAEADMAKVQSDAMQSQAKNQVDAFNAETKRLDVMASNDLKQVDAAKKVSEIKGNELDNLQKRMSVMSDQELLAMLR